MTCPRGPLGPNLVIYITLLCTIIISAHTDKVSRVRRQSDGWSDWGAESECSRSCGGGVSYKERTCLNIGDDGRPLCTGPKKIYQSCNLQDCPSGSRDFRLEQCERYNDIKIEDKLHDWVPYYGGSNQCELNCLAKGQKFYYRHAAKVVDGTPCGPGTLDICVDGLCQPVGCDKVLGSNITFDKCHECGGDGSSCKTMEGVVYTSGLRNGYNDAILIPAGATSITITEEEATNSYLALRDLQGHYLLNGDWRINLAHPKDIAGSVFHYHRGATPQSSPENIVAEGPTVEPLFLVILHQPGGDTAITYKYSVPKHINQGSSNTYSWEASEWGSCSQSCGGGTQTREVTCHRTSDLEPVGGDLCDHRQKPEVSRTCVDNSCPATWIGSEWSKCSTTCGAGVQVRSVLCKQVTSGGIVAVVHHKNCEGSPVESTRACNVDVECPMWETGIWSRCNRMCGPGERQRNVICRAQQELVNATSDILPDWRCDLQEKPEAFEECNEGPCEGLEWVTSAWSGCPSSCGITVETRHVICTSQSGVVFDSEMCDPDIRPATTRPCPHNITCSPDPQWHASQWSECSARCGPGFQHRRVVCAQYVDGELDQVDLDRCTPEERMPARQNCSGEDCVGIWFNGPWGKCSLPCGGGLRNREVMCLSGKKPVNAVQCDSNLRPDASEECNLEPCDEDNLLGVCKEAEYGCCPDGITAAEGPNFFGCPAKDRIPTGLCIETEFGCCLDGITPAQGPFSAGCPLFTCRDTLYGCCKDGQTPAGGPKDEECPKHFGCAVTAYGCCPDGFTPADGYGGEGCESEPIKPSRTCHEMKYGCCPDGISIAQGPDFEGCLDVEGSGETCEENVHGCCADGETPAQGPNKQGCPEGPGNCDNDIYGCCPDGHSTALGPNFYGCPGIVVPPEESGCAYTIYGCCPDGEIAALGPEGQGCGYIIDADCIQSIYGCCQDGESVALGPNFAGCEFTCDNSVYGCCPDNEKEAQGPNFEGCDDSIVVVTCENTQFGCCPDYLTPAQGYNYAGCNITQQEGDCDATTFGCCIDGSTVALGPNFEGCTEEGSYELSCHDTPYGCCPDGEAAAEGPNNAGCPSLMMLKDACSLPSEAGSCNNYSVKWFFDTLSGDCARFWYGGCDGNTNRYETREECLQTCMEPQGIRKCYLPKSTGRCRANVPKFYYNVDERQCEEFTYGGCQGNNNKFDTIEECDEECVVPQRSSVCNQPHLTGPCRGNMPRWFFDAEQGQCQQFIYGGCKGNDNRFETLDQCEARCQQPASIVCRLPSVTGPCRGALDAWFFNIDSGECQEFVYGGCRGNANRFSTRQDCEHTCSEFMEKKTVDPCSLSKDTGPCRGYMQRWYYDQIDQRCQLFIYGGCQGNENRFESERECRQRCNAQPPEDMCVLPKDPGPCEAFYEQYYYDTSVGRCELFHYGGCEGNANRYATLEECEKACRHHINPGVTETPSTSGRCEQPKDAGPCVAYMPRWHYNAEEGSCQQFIYGGCQGNRNRFMNLEDCREACMTDVMPTPTDAQDVCVLPPEGGPCYDYFPSWYYDASEDRCHQFVYGGCNGNGNRFDSEQHCERECSKKGDSECVGHEFKCDDGQCIDVIRRCDTYNDCRDYSDEVDCHVLVSTSTSAASVTTTTPSSATCEWYEERCDNGACFDLRRKCDDYDDCRDGTDERDCDGNSTKSSPCEWFEAQCGDSGQCIDRRLLCDSYLDCENGSDEADCAVDAGRACDWFEIQCDNGQCIDERLRCNSVYDCEDGSDELDCAVDICALPQDTGECRAYIPSWYYDSTYEQCVQFVYGGCGGNANRFETAENCIAKCGGPSPVEPTADPGDDSDICSLPAETGMCRAYIPSWYYDPSSQQCAQFVYGGCEGNANRFATVEECERACASTRVQPTEGPSSKTTTTDQPITGLAVCSLNNEHGPCREAYDRWYYDREEGKCLQFIYGGCRGSENNFESVEECESTCIVQDICYLSSDGGSCSASKTRYYYEPATGQCQEFTYSGCEGNANRFLTMKNCENVCLRNVQPPVVTSSQRSWTDEPAGDACEMDHETGPCRDWEIMWYFNKVDQGCGQFYYGGCDGNGNRFATSLECEARCVGTKTTPTPEPTTPFTGDVCTLPSDTGPCAEYEILWYYDVTDGRCLQFWYGGCQGNNNRYATEDECAAQCPRDKGAATTPHPDHEGHTTTRGKPTKGEVTGICALPNDPGQCDDYSVMWYFESESMACRRFHYGGCDGNENRFETVKECEMACVYNQPDHHVTYTPSPHGGGDGHRVQPTEPTVAVEFDVCDAPMDIGDCDDKHDRWFYNMESGMCQSFTYSGCGGNGNQFKSLEHCEDICVERKWKDVCSFPPDSGSCPEVESDMAPYWFFNSNTGVCEAFLYSGCDGNSNRFKSADECQSFCTEATSSVSTLSVTRDGGETEVYTGTPLVTMFTPSDVCKQPAESGPCRAWQPRWYYDAASNSCKDFIFGGCQGNANNFVSQEKCEYVCEQETVGAGQDVCTLSHAVGPCTAFTERWYFDQGSQQCLQFSYGGCQGNANNFMSVEECRASCGSGGADERGPLDPEQICMMPREQGPCFADMLRFNYDEETGECRPFIFGGCQGNANNFETQEDCYRMCGSSSQEFKIRRPGDCFEKQDNGPCDQALTRWFFNSNRGDCSPFYYGGCQGNGNNFHDYEDCLAMCSRVTDTCGVLTCDLDCPFGYERGNDGCPMCSCHDPCENYVCPSHMECQVEQQICLTEPCPAPKPICVAVPKEGECPAIDVNLAGSCVQQCQKDYDCPLNQKCCSNGCGRTCVDPSAPDPNQKAGSCPASMPAQLASVCLVICDYDMDCPDNGKCCKTDCGLICLPPAANTTGCANSVFGCCLDGITPAGGYNFRGCPEEEPVIVSDAPENFLATEGGRLMLPCTARGAPQPQISWFKDGFPILDVEEDAHIEQLDDGSLVVSPVERTDGGVYTCRAYNGVGPPATRKYVVNLQVSLSFRETPNEINARPGETTRLVCSADGHPAPELRWLREGREIMYDSTHFVEGGYGVLLITDVHLEDGGEYECEATNPFGESLRRPFQLSVVGPISLELVDHNTTWAAGDDLELECLVDGDGDIELSWMKNDAALPEDDRIVATPDGSLIIHGIIKDDAGSYHCVAKRGDEEISASTLIKVEGVKLPDDCVDKPWLAKCDLIIKARLCDHKYFSDFCCLSCHQAGLLP